MHHFFVNPSQVNEREKQIVIRGGDVNHIRNVLRMKVSEDMLVSDGQGHDYMCRIAAFEEGTVLADITGETFEGTELRSKIYLFQGLPKSDKMELIIQKAVELGVYQVIPVSTRRSVVKLDEKKAAAKIKRWNGIAESAAKQSRRGIVPEVTGVMTFGQAVAYAESLEWKLIPYENFKDIRSTGEIIEKICDSSQSGSIGIFIGPEGGFDEAEVGYAVEHGIHPVSLGRRILRTETAGLMLLSVIMYHLENGRNNETVWNEVTNGSVFR